MVTTRSSKTSVKVPEKAADKKEGEMEVEPTPEEKAAEKRQLVVEDIRAQFKELEKAASQKEPRQVAKVNPQHYRFIPNTAWLITQHSISRLTTCLF